MNSMAFKAKSRILSGLCVSILLTGAILLSLQSAQAADAAKLILKQGARIAVVGDSITEQKLYSRYIECYLQACVPQLEAKVIQLGWGGETAPGFAARMDNDLISWKPDVATMCYGMNDGGYRAYDDAIGKRYEAAMRDIVTRLKKAGATVVIGSPGAVDSFYFKRGAADAATVYNENLAKLGELDQKLAKEFDMPYADVHTPMMAAMEKAKAQFGEKYDVCGGDGVHPAPNGHVVMAYAFLKAMGLDGNIGTITADLKGKADASEGHKVVSFDKGKLELESTRYPFCFYGDGKAPNSTRSILAFIPFNQDLNRLTLVVKNLGADKAKVTWGKATKDFTAKELEQGVNLAAEFLDNPFYGLFANVERAVAAKQVFETTMIKGVITGFRGIRNAVGKDDEAEAALGVLTKKLYAKDDALHQAVRAALVPVKHTITIEPAAEK